MVFLVFFSNIRNMAQVCDLVHESVQSAEVILCSVIPREADRRPQGSGSRIPDEAANYSNPVSLHQLTTPISLYENYCMNIQSEKGTFIIQYNQDGDIVCCLNNNNESDGSFKFNDCFCKKVEARKKGLFLLYMWNL